MPDSARLPTLPALARATPCIAAAFMSGCAVNDRGARVTQYETDTARVVRLDAWGIHVLTGVPDAGVTLGHSTRLYFYPRPDAPKARESCWPLPDRIPTVRPTTMPVPMGQLGSPLAYCNQMFGFSVQANSSQVGLTVGAAGSDVVSIPEGFNGILVINCVPAAPELCQIHIVQQEPTR